MKKIERKFIFEYFPFTIDGYKKIEIEEGYISLDPEIRVRKEEGVCTYTYESDDPLDQGKIFDFITEAAYDHFINQAKRLGNVTRRTRYLIPIIPHQIVELDYFHDDLEGLQIARIEFEDAESVLSFQPPIWFGEEKTGIEGYKDKNILNHLKDTYYLRRVREEVS